MYWLLTTPRAWQGTKTSLIWFVVYGWPCAVSRLLGISRSPGPPPSAILWYFYIIVTRPTSFSTNYYFPLLANYTYTQLSEFYTPNTWILSNESRVSFLLLVGGSPLSIIIGYFAINSYIQGVSEGLDPSVMYKSMKHLSNKTSNPKIDNRRFRAPESRNNFCTLLNDDLQITLLIPPLNRSDTGWIALFGS